MISNRPTETASFSLGGILAAIALLAGVELSSGQTAAILFLFGAAPGVITTIVVWVRGLRTPG